MVDGMLSGTGIRDRLEGGYVGLETLGLSSELTAEFVDWLARYESAHFAGYADALVVSELDRQGIVLAGKVAAQRPDDDIGYFSDALLTRLS
ncbi:MAG: hypothetical protein ACO1O3_22330 [Sphingobium sp.]